jgi:hypothetical protein
MPPKGSRKTPKTASAGLGSTTPSAAAPSTSDSGRLLPPPAKRQKRASNSRARDYAAEARAFMAENDMAKLLRELERDIPTTSKPLVESRQRKVDQAKTTFRTAIEVLEDLAKEEVQDSNPAPSIHTARNRGNTDILRLPNDPPSTSTVATPSPSSASGDLPSNDPGHEVSSVDAGDMSTVSLTSMPLALAAASNPIAPAMHVALPSALNNAATEDRGVLGEWVVFDQDAIARLLA